eukprot:COSAG04_NODE_1038_length_8607_cov_2.977433_2_plen_146_part_00
MHSSKGASDIVADRWGCDDNLLTLDVGETYRLKMVMAAELVTIYINDEPACKSHHRSLLRIGPRPLRPLSDILRAGTADRADRQVWTDVNVYMADPWYRTADATVANLYFCEGTCGGSGWDGDPAGCADGSREGFEDQNLFPKIA